MSLSDILYSPLHRFYTFVLKKLIGDYLKEDLKHKQLEVQLRKGVVELHDIELDVEARIFAYLFPELTEKLQALNSSIEGLPFSIVKASVRTIRAEIPWHSLSNRNCKIILKVLE